MHPYIGVLRSFKSITFLWHSRKGGGLSTGSQHYSEALTLLVRWDFNAPKLYINVRLLSRRNKPKRSRGNFQRNYQEMFLNGETNCQSAKEPLGDKWWFSPHESCFVELEKEVNNIQEGRSCNGGQVHGLGRGLGSRCYHPFCHFYMSSAGTNSRPSALVLCYPLT